MRHPGGAPILLLRHPVTGLPDRAPLPPSPGAAGRLMVIVSTSGNLSLVYINVLTASGTGLVAEESKVTLNPEVLLSGCTTCWYGVAGQPWESGGGWRMAGAI